MSVRSVSSFKIFIFVLSLYVGFVFVLSGSAIAQSPTTIQAGSRATIVFADTELSGSITVAEPKFRKVGAFTQAQFQIQSLREEQIVIEHQVKWQDKDGFDVPGPAVAWQVATIPAGAPATIQTSGRTIDSHSIRVIIRYAGS